MYRWDCIGIDNDRLGLVGLDLNASQSKSNQLERSFGGGGGGNPLFLSESSTIKLLNIWLCCLNSKTLRTNVFFSQTGANCLSGKLPGREADWDSGYSDG